MARKKGGYLELRKPTKHGFVCIDHEPIEEWQPEDPLNAECWIDIYLGTDDAPGSDYFTFHVVTHRALADIQGPEQKKYLVVLPYYSWSLVEERVDAILDQCKGRDWQEMCDHLRKFFHWEFEDMA